MRVITGKVENSQVILEGDRLEDGAKVTVVVQEGDDSFGLKPADEAVLLEAVGDADRCEVTDAEDLLSHLDSEG